MPPTVALVAPDGRTFDVPEENVAAARAAGWQLSGIPEADAVTEAPAPIGPPAPQRDTIRMRVQGREFDVPRDNLQAAMDAGWEPVTTIGEDIRTGAEGTARGTTLGGSDFAQVTGAGVGTQLGENIADELAGGPVARATGPGINAPVAAPENRWYDPGAAKESLQGIRTRQVASPVIAGATEAGGAIATAIATGGSGALAQAARATPAGITTLIGTRVQARLAQKAGETALGRLGALAAGSAVESAAQGATTRVVDDLLENDFEISAERMVNGLGNVIKDGAVGALTGAATGGAIEGSSAALRAGQSRLARSGAQAAEGAEQAAARQAAESQQAAQQAAAQAEQANQYAVQLATQRASQAELHAAQQAALEAQHAAQAAALRAQYAVELAARPVQPRSYDITLEPAEAAESAGPTLARDLPTLADNTNSQIVRAARGSVDGFEDVQQGAVRAIEQDHTELLKLRAEIAGNANIGSKRSEAAHITSDDFDVIEGARTRANTMFDDIDSALFTTTELDGYKAALNEGGGLTAFTRIGQASREARAIANTALDEGRIGDAFMVIDDFKRIVGRGQRTPNSVAKYKIREWYDNIVKPAGEDEAAWGQLATKQKRVNPRWAASIGYENDDLVQPFTRTSGTRRVDPWENDTESNSKAWGSLLNELGTAESEQTEKAIRMQLRSAVVDAQTRADAWGTAADIRRAHRMTDLVESIENRMNAVALAKQDKKAFEKMMQLAPSTLGQGALKLGRLVGKLTPSSAAPIDRLADAAQGQQLAMDKAVGTAAKNLLGSDVSRAIDATPKLKQIAAPPPIPDLTDETTALATVRPPPLGAAADAPELPATTSTALSVRPPSLPPAGPQGAASPKALLATVVANRVHEAVSQAQALQDPQSPESGRLRQAVNELAQDDPRFAAAMDAKQRQQAAFLAEKAGPVRDEGDPFNVRPAPRDQVSDAKLGRYVAAVDDPGLALDRLAQGVASAEDLEVLQTLYPRVYDVFVQRVQEQIDRASASGKSPSVTQRQHLHRATGIPVSREQQPGALPFLQRVGNAPTEPAQPPPGPSAGKGMNIDAEKHFASRADQIMAGD